MGKKKLYHYLITVEGSGRDGLPRYGMYSDTIEWSGTRHEAFCHLLDEVTDKSGIIPNTARAVCWSFEPNEL